MSEEYWPKTKGEVVQAFLEYLAATGLQLATKSIGEAKGTPNILNNFATSGGSVSPVLGSVALIYGTIIGATLASRDSELAEKVLDAMTSNANSNPTVMSGGGFDKVHEKVNKEISTLIKAWDTAE